jgi:4-amino-4-deoxy-L-arabinose transferase-like glycosyltransferase
MSFAERLYLQLSELAKHIWLLLFLVVIAFYLYGLGHIPFIGPDESRYAQVAREMFLRHDLITPTLGGRVWFEKPVLLYWMIIASFRLFGVSEWAARLGPALSGLLTVTAVYWVSRRIELAAADSQTKDLALCSSLVTATSVGIILFSRAASFDIVVTMTLTWALGFFLASELVENDGRRRRLLLAAFYIFVGLSLLAKGLVGIVIPFGVIGGYHIFRRELPHCQTVVSLSWGLPLACAVAAIWYGPIIARHGWHFLDQFFIQHHFVRYVSNKYHHPEAIHFYPLMLIFLTLPWTAFLLEAIVRPGLRRGTEQSPFSKARVFAFAWLLVPVVFFSFAQSKLPGYILPVVPAAALLAGQRLAKFRLAQGTGKWAMRITGLVLVLVALGETVYAEQSRTLPLGCAVLIAAPLLVVGSFAVFLVRYRTQVMTLIVCATLLAFVIALNCGVSIVERESTKNLLQLASARGYGDAPVFALHQIDRAAEFYAAGRVVYGSDGEPLKLEGSYEVAIEANKARRPILVFVPMEYVWQLTQPKSIRIEPIGDNGKLALIGVTAQ